jgi:DtxR family Mn-dependent transcriptional regulator
MDRRDRENVLEAILMAGERGISSMHGICERQRLEFDEDQVETLVEEGLVTREGDDLSLTPAGRVIAEDVTRRHRLTEVMLATFLGIDKQRSSEISCIVEHDIRPEMVDGVCTLLGHPTTCPHGNPIPPGPCCKDGRTVVPSQVVPLTRLRPGERGRIVYITPRDHQRLHRLTSLGVTPGVILEVHNRHPAFTISFEETDLAIDEDVAGDIHVSRIPNGSAQGRGA